MRRLQRPNFAQAPVYAACVHGIRDPALAARFTGIAQQVVAQEAVYERQAVAGQLSGWPAHGIGDDDVPSLNPVTRGEFKRLYTGQLARSGSQARRFYDEIRVSAPNNICPYCGFGTVETVDHFLPKARYSSLSVMPLNLVPACSDCNKKKHDGQATVGNLSPHPYFEGTEVYRDEWVYARIRQIDRPCAEYYAVPPLAWPLPMRQRVLNHFNNLELAVRFGVQAAERLQFSANQIHGMHSAGIGAAIPELLQIFYFAELAATGVNSWQTALAKTVANDAWFRAAGYAQLL